MKSPEAPLPQAGEGSKSLDAEVIIEGVETQAQLELARHAGIHLVQGYLLGRPAAALSWDAAGKK